MAGRAFNSSIILIALLLALVMWLTREELPKEVSGRAKTVDGDSLFVADEEIRLVGIDAPEGRQMCKRAARDWSCGREAARQLRRLIGDQEVFCDVEDIDKYNRLLAVCDVGEIELNRWMVKHGWAVSYGRYEYEEGEAERKKRGIWQGTFEQPRTWRDQQQ